MAKIKDSINSSIFFAMKVAEDTRIPVLLLGNPGLGKTSTAEMYCEIMGYKSVLLRGATMSETEIMGFDAVHNTEEGLNIKRVLPSWYEMVLEYDRQGYKTVLFVDEITNSPAYIQASLLQLIFNRKVENETIPDSVIILSAGNSLNNMTSEFQTLSALWNRFCIFNITADDSALDEFLSSYDGASTGNMRNLLDLKKETLERMNSQGLKMSEEMINRVGQYFETAIRETARSLMKSGDKPLDLNCTETQSVYASQEGDELMRGFVSLRTLHYLVKYTCSTYKLFGKEGIKSDNFKKIVLGLCGVALSRKNGEVVKTKVEDHFFQSIVQSLSSIDKLNNDKIKYYEEFFNKIVEKKSNQEFTTEEISVILNKFDELSNDDQVKDVCKPLEDVVVNKLCKLMEYNSRKTITIRIVAGQDVQSTLTTEKCTSMITRWNSISDMYNKVFAIVKNPKNTYPDSVVKSLEDARCKMTEDYMKIGSYTKLTANNFPEFKNLVPEIKKLNK